MLQQAIDIKTVKFAVDWQQKDIGQNRILLTHETNRGSMVYDQAQQIVMVFDRATPTVDQIEIATEFHLRRRDPQQSIEERLLEAESSVLSNMKRLDYCFRSPFKVFPLIDKAFAVVESLFKGIEGHTKSEWIVFIDNAQWQAFQAASKLLEEATSDGNKLDELRARNSLRFLTGKSYSRWFVVYDIGGPYPGWQQAMVREIEAADDIEYHTGYGFVSCHTCGYDHSIMYSLYNRGDHMHVLEGAWLKHNQSHPDCTGDLHS